MKNACLLIIDIQNGYFGGGRNVLTATENAALNAKAVLDKFGANNFPVILFNILP